MNSSHSLRTLCVISVFASKSSKFSVEFSRCPERGRSKSSETLQSTRLHSVTPLVAIAVTAPDVHVWFAIPTRHCRAHKGCPIEPYVTSQVDLLKSTRFAQPFETIMSLEGPVLIDIDQTRFRGS
jgi:hypothetical protein